MRQVPNNTKQCPADGRPLMWEQFGGMRIYTTDSKGVRTYKLQCPFCAERYFLRRKDKPNER